MEPRRRRLRRGFAVSALKDRFRGTPERESLATFLEPFDGGTVLTPTHERLPDDTARNSHEEGWNGLLDKLPVFLGVAP